VIRLKAPAAGADAVVAVVVGLATVTVEPCTAVGACIVVQESLTDTSCNKGPVNGGSTTGPSRVNMLLPSERKPRLLFCADRLRWHAVLQGVFGKGLSGTLQVLSTLNLILPL